jgi:D-sedoheptulose 7-phosphate isomerase
VEQYIAPALTAAAAALERLRGDAPTHGSIAKAAALLVRCFEEGNRVYACGNGGSLCEAMHIAEELSGNYRAERDPLPAVALADPAYLTCVANDFGFERVFERQVRAHMREGDVLMAISTSGDSPNIVAAARAAQELGASVVSLTGHAGSALSEAADVEICTPAEGMSDRVQEQQVVVVHLLVELVERSLFPANYNGAP